jgi:hypothetical protein
MPRNAGWNVPGEHQRGAGRVRLELDAHPLKLGLEVPPGDVVLRRKVTEERPPPDPGGIGDVVDRRPGEAVPLEKLERDMFQFGARGDTAAADRRRSLCRRHRLPPLVSGTATRPRRAGRGRQGLIRGCHDRSAGALIDASAG